MPDWTDASLLLVAHGSSRYPDGAQDVLRLADLLRERALFAAVDVAFWRQEPIVSRDHLQGQRIFVLPYFAGLGKHTEQLIPDRLGLTGELTRLPHQKIHYCQPVGCHPRVATLIHKRALALGLLPADTALLVIGHGARDGGAGRTPEIVAQTLRGLGGFAEVVTAYLEQAPFAEDWRLLVSVRQIIVQPLLLSAGMHASDDIPPLFGMAADSRSPQQTDDHQIWLQQGIGEDSEIIDMMLDQVRAADSGDSP